MSVEPGTIAGTGGGSAMVEGGPRHGEHADTLAAFAVACALISAGRPFSEVSLHKPH